jgi:hypothetical protein
MLRLITWSRPWPSSAHQTPLISALDQSESITHFYNIKLLPHWQLQPNYLHIYYIRLPPPSLAPGYFVSLSSTAQISWRSCTKSVLNLLLRTASTVKKSIFTCSLPKLFPIFCYPSMLHPRTLAGYYWHDDKSI